jgi:hypothetical protein
VFRVLARVYKADLAHGLLAPVFAEFCRAFERCCSLLRLSGVSFTTGDWLEQVVASFRLGDDRPVAVAPTPPVRISRWVIGAAPPDPAAIADPAAVADRAADQMSDLSELG